MYYVQCKDVKDGVQCPEIMGYGTKIPALFGVKGSSLLEDEAQQEGRVITLKCPQDHIHNYFIPSTNSSK